MKKILHHLTTDWYKYLLELIVITAGVLGAFALNNWNENRLIQKRTNGYLQSIAEDLKSDISFYGLNIDDYGRDLDYNRRVIINDEYQNLSIDSIEVLVHSYYQVDRTSNHTYERIKSTGLVESLGTAVTNKAINNYYNVDIPYYEALLQWDKEYNDKEFDFWAYNSKFEAGNFRNDNNELPFKESSEKRKSDLIALIESTQGRNHLRNAIVRHEHTMKRVQEIRLRAQALLELINSELDIKQE